MRMFFKWLLRASLVCLIAIAALAYFERDRITRLLATTSLFAPDNIVGNFTTMGDLFESAPIPFDPERANPLPTGPQMDMPAGFTTWAQDRAVTGIMVLKGGTIRHESYPTTTYTEESPAETDIGPHLSNRISWSVAKSFLSVLMGVLVDDGTIPDLDAPVTQYAPSLIGSAYDGATIRNVLQMSSGVVFDEDYLDFWSDINKMGRILALGGSMDGFAENLTETYAPAGLEWQYTSIDTHVLGMVIRGATGRTIPDLLHEKVTGPLGVTTQPYYLTDGYGVAFVLGGLNMTTHDYALFDHMVASGGIVFGTRIVSEDWIEQSTRPSAPTAAGEIGYGYQWWIPVGANVGQFMGRGIYGQYLYIDRPRGVVIAVNGADRQFRAEGVAQSNVDMFRQIAESLE